MAPVSWKLPASKRRSIRSRTFSRPAAVGAPTPLAPPHRPPRPAEAPRHLLAPAELLELWLPAHRRPESTGRYPARPMEPRKRAFIHEGHRLVFDDYNRQ